MRQLGLAVAEAAEDGEGVPRTGLPHQFAACLDLPVEPRGQRVGVLPGRRADDQVAPAPHRAVPLGLEAVGELVGRMVAAAVDPDLPRGMARVDLFLLPRLAGCLAAPAVLLVDPALDLALADQVARPLGVRGRGRVDEDLIAVAGDREAARALGLVQPDDQRVGIGRGEMDAVVVGYAGILPYSAMPVCSRCFVMPPRKNG